MIIKFLFVIEFKLVLQFTNSFASENFSFIIRSECSASLILFHLVSGIITQGMSTYTYIGKFL
ncbi:conserved hypothetical protein [Xenorhabdus innexi]|uniref:Uncharacterized protein n=1 Tax=Xenorhabdus innexi TaxID=290109 RepID=A0A1N6MQY0_9GAMM|nr:conserved hypothetical protein [Xenorhabdus innexi]